LNALRLDKALTSKGKLHKGSCMKKHLKERYCSALLKADDDWGAVKADRAAYLFLRGSF